MKYEYKVLRETEIDNLVLEFNSYAEEGYRVIFIACNNDEFWYLVTNEKIINNWFTYADEGW